MTCFQPNLEAKTRVDQIRGRVGGSNETVIGAALSVKASFLAKLNAMNVEFHE